MPYSPKRIVCLTSETVEILYLLGAEERIVGISGFAHRPPHARKEKAIVSTFNDASLEKILQLQPDLVIGHSDVQASIARRLIAEGLSVWINNHRSIKGILDMVFQLGVLVDKREKSLQLITEMEDKMKEIKDKAKDWKKKPRVYFEEWYEPLVTGIQWVSELVEVAGGEDIFSEKRSFSQARNRVIENPQEVVERNPDIILASWCGKKLKREKMLSRPNWNDIRAIQNDQLFDIPSDLILQPGPAAIFEGLPMIHGMLEKYQSKEDHFSQT